MGTLDSLVAPKCKLKRDADQTSGGKETIALCWAKADFKRSSVKVNLKLILEKNQSSWKIREFIFVDN
jgi:hypothetical protein